MSKSRVALVQNNAGRDFDRNCATLDRLLDQAASRDAQFALTPEFATCLAMKDGRLDVGAEPFENHAGLAWAKAAAKTRSIWLLLGSIGVLEPSGKIKNRSCLIDPRGELVAHYDKIHLFDVDLASGESYRESAVIEPGAAAQLAKTPFGRLGMTVCYDVRFPQLYRSLAQAGADVFAIPSAFAATTGRAHWEPLLRARAIENGAFVLAPGQCGVAPDGSLRRHGHSMIVAPWGDRLAAAGSEETVIIAEIDLERSGQARKMVPSLRHDRPFSQPDRF